MSTSKVAPKLRLSSPLAANGFERVTGSFYLYTPQSSRASPPYSGEPSPNPDIILFFGWGNAPPRAIVKYTAEYQHLYPKAQILLFLTTFSEIFLYTSKRHSKSIDLAIKYLSSKIGVDQKPSSRILVHLFSNAGSFKFRELARCYRQESFGRSLASAAEPILPVSFMVLDSSPGRPSFYRRMVGTQTQLPRQIVLYWLGSVVVFFVLCAFAVVQFIIRRVSILDRVWLSLNDISSEGQLASRSTRRLYIYSKMDELVDWQDVVDHAADAQSKGFKVQAEEFSNSKHVAHVLVDGKRYWSLIRNGWEEAISDEL